MLPCGKVLGCRRAFYAANLGDAWAVAYVGEVLGNRFDVAVNGRLAVLMKVFQLGLEFFLADVAGLL